MAKKIPNIKPSQPWQRFEVGRTILYKVRWIKNILLLHKYHSRIIFTVLPRFRSNRTKGQEFSKNFLNKVLFDLNRKQFRIHLIYRYAKCRVGMQDQSICNYIGCVLLMHFTLLCAKPTPRPIKGKQAFECCFLVFLHACANHLVHPRVVTRQNTPKEVLTAVVFFGACFHLLHWKLTSSILPVLEITRFIQKQVKVREGK